MLVGGKIQVACALKVITQRRIAKPLDRKAYAVYRCQIRKQSICLSRYAVERNPHQGSTVKIMAACLDVGSLAVGICHNLMAQTFA